MARMANGFDAGSLNAKRQKVSPRRLRERAAAGEIIDPETRALVRMGAASTRIITGQDDLSTFHSCSCADHE